MIFGYIDPGTGFTITSAGGLILMFLSGALGFLALFFKKIFKFMKRHKKPLIIISIIALIILVTAGIKLMNQKSDFQDKIVILGFDGLSPQIVERLMQQGKLPNFSRLKEKGDFHTLATTNPPQSPVAWTGFSTGQNPGKNGIFEFITRDPKTYRLKLSMSETATGQAKPVIRTPRFWQYTSRKSVPAVILNCPVTFPPDKITGRMVAGMGVPDVLGTEGTFSFYTSQQEPERETTGGKVFFVKRSPLMIMNLNGPKVAKMGSAGENVQVPFKVEPGKDNSVSITLQGKTINLKAGEWSGWQEVIFPLGFLRKMKGIFKFYLVETDPEFKLYVSPINFDPRQQFFPITSPASYGQELTEQIGLYHTLGMPFDTWALNEERIDEKVFLDNVYDVLREREAMLELELNRMESGILYAYFESSDIMQHMFWRYMDENHPLYEPNAPQEYKNMIASWYERMDGILGRVMHRIGPDDTLIVLSDHGFDTFRRAVHVNTWLRDNGYLELKDPAAMQGAPLLKDVDWSRTKAYALGFNAIYINEKGREKEGIVSPGAEKEKLKDEIASKLEQWTDKKYDARVVNKVYKREEAFWGPLSDETPDLVVGFSLGYRASWQTALGDAPKNDMEDNLRKWSGSHLFDPALVPGILFTNRKLAKQNPAIIDIAPTVLKIVGFTPEEMEKFDLDGSPLF